MRKFLNIVRTFRDEEAGAAMIEYSVLIGLITAAVIATVVIVGTWVDTQWDTLCVATAGAGAGC